MIATDVRTGKEGGVALDNDVASDEQRMRKVLPLLRSDQGQRSQVAGRCALCHPGVSGVEIGMAEISHLKLAIEATEMVQPPDDLLAKLNELANYDFNLS